MTKDLFGTNRLKINLHTHTTLSDGAKTPKEVAEIYKKAGYDVIAITDHWLHRENGTLDGLRILSGAEYNIGGGDASTGVYHILGIGCSKKPDLTEEAGPQKIIDEVHRCHGLAILAHPAWSLNTAEQAKVLHGVDGTEIFNSVSDAGESSRPYSGDFVDTAACQGLFYPLIADDGTHMYDGSDEMLQMRNCWQQSKKKNFMRLRDRRFILEEMAMKLPSFALRSAEFHSSQMRCGRRVAVTEERN